jgi:hypothetical protein
MTAKTKSRSSGTESRRRSSTDESESGLGDRIAFRIEKSLYASLERWCAIYQVKEGRSITPPKLARRWLHFAARYFDRKIDRGEIDPNKPLDADEALP